MSATGIVLALALAAAPDSGGRVPHFGLLEMLPDGTTCLTTRATKVQPGDSLLVVYLGPAGFAVGRVGSPREQRCVENRGAVGDSLRFFTVRLAGSAEPDRGDGIAVIGNRLIARVADDGVEVWAPGEDIPIHFRVCGSREGEHFTAWRGTLRIWHEYDYLGFDLEPDCTDAEADP